MVRQRGGLTRLGCLLTMLILTAIGYFGFNVGEAYFNFYRYRDLMRGEASFAANRTDIQIQRRVAAFADSLGLPDPADRVAVQRGKHDIQISAEYSVRIELPGYVREIHFSPSATGSF
jgi:hypothetical protein